MTYDATTLAPPPPIPDTTPKPIAPWWHTAALVALLALTTTFTHHRAATKLVTEAPRIPQYIASIAMEWVLLGLVIAGIYRKREFFVMAFRNRATTLLQSIGFGFLVYIMGFIAIALTGAALYFTPLFHKRNEAVILAIAPHTPLEFFVWFLVSLTAGMTEEIIFRGYLTQQLSAWTRSPIAAIFVAALLFGSVHLYEGLGAIVPLAALAVVYGFVVRYYKGDLRAVVIAHTLQDFIVALLMLARPWIEQHQPKG
jgi:membrane protease YdiL (CAAX protease family)